MAERGDLVICVRGGEHGYAPFSTVKGAVYRIRDIVVRPDGRRGCYLEEMRLPIHPGALIECGWLENRFRPVSPTALDVFRSVGAHIPALQEP